MKIKHIIFYFSILLIILGNSKAFSQIESPFFFKEGELWGLKSSNGVVITTPKYTNDYQPYFYVLGNYFAQVELNGKIGFVDTNGKEVIPIQYDYINGIHFGNVFQVSKNEKWGLLSLISKKELTPFIYDYFDYINTIYFSDSRDLETDSQEDLIKTNVGGVFQEGEIKGGKWGLILVNDSVSKEILPLGFDQIICQEEFINARINDTWQSYDYSGNLLFPEKYSYIEFFSKLNLFLVSIEGGKKMNESGWFDDRHYVGGKWGFIDRQGKIIVPIQYDYIRPKPYRNPTNEENDLVEENDLIKVGLNNKYGIIDSKGKQIIPIKYDEIDDNIYSFNDFMDILPYNDENGLFKVKLNEKWGMINLEDKTVIPIIYDKIDYYNGIYQCTVKNKIVNLDKTGKKSKKI